MAESIEVATEPGAPIAAMRVSGALYWLAPGTFAVGTEGFMIAGLLSVAVIAASSAAGSTPGKLKPPESGHF